MPAARYVFVALLPLAAAGCSRARAAAMVPMDMVVGNTSTQSVQLTVSLEQMEKGVGYSFLEARDFEDAIKRALERSRLFASVSTRDGATADLRLEVDAQLNVPGSTPLTAVVTGVWRLTDTRTSRVLSERLVETSGTAGMGDSIMALTRIRIAIERAAQKFIRAGIEATARADFFRA